MRWKIVSQLIARVNWQFDLAKLFEEWGQQKIRKLCEDWKKRRTQSKLEKFRHDYSEFLDRINGLQEQEQADLNEALARIAEIERIDAEDFRIIASSMIAGVERESVKKIIRRINAASDEALEELIAAVNEWDIVSAVSTAEVIVGKIEIIKQFEDYIVSRLPEKKGRGQLDIQTFIKTHPWLLGHEYEHLSAADFHHEHGVDKWIEEVLQETDQEYKQVDSKREGRRFDLLCIKNDWQILILELMRPGTPCDYDHITRLNRYVTRVESKITNQGTAKVFKGKTVYGLLVADGLEKDASLNKTLQDLRSSLDAMTWGALLQRVSSRYRDFFEILRLKAPDDPRMKGLVNLNSV